MPLTFMTCHLKQVCVAVTKVQGTLDSYVISHFVVQITDYRACKGPLEAFRSVLLSEAGANTPVPFLTDYLTLHDLSPNQLRKYTGKQTVQHTAVVGIQ